MARDACHVKLIELISQQEEWLISLLRNYSFPLADVLKGYRSYSQKDLWRGNKKRRDALKEVLNAMDDDMVDRIGVEMQKGMDLSHVCTDKTVDKFVKGLDVSGQWLEGKYFRNQEAMEFWIKSRKRKMKLSPAVWKKTGSQLFGGQAERQIELLLAEGLLKGRDAPSIARDLRKFLVNPDARFRRVRDPKTGKLVLSTPAKNYHPGRGVYRSAYQNALRLARNEVNIAYRQADFDRRQRLEFVKAIEIKLSFAHPRYDICDEMVGIYPKDFIWTGWHPNCLCYSTTILMDDEEFKRYLETGVIPKYQVNDIPARAKKYIAENSARWRRWKSPPYWLRDNFKYSLDYRGGHQINYDPEYNSTLDDLTNGGKLLSSDFYRNPRHYGMTFQGEYGELQREAFSLALEARNNPDKLVTVYRAVPPKVGVINSGDWVSLSRGYAEEHAAGRGEGWTVLETKVPAGNVVWDGNDILEMSWFRELNEESEFSDGVYEYRPYIPWKRDALRFDFNDPEAIRHNINYARRYGIDTEKLYLDEDGIMYPERQVYLESVYQDLMARAAQDKENGLNDDNTIYMTGGAPANGKSSVLEATKKGAIKEINNAEELPNYPDILTLNADLIKEKLPEYDYLTKIAKDPMAAAFVHEESSALMKRVLAETIDKRYDIILDATNDGNLTKLRKKFKQYSDGGRNRLVAHYVSLDSDLSYIINEHRYNKENRYVPFNFQKAVNEGMPATIKAIIRENLLDEMYLWDTNQKDRPRLILTFKNGKLRIYDKALLRRFFRKGIDLRGDMEELYTPGKTSY